MKQLKEIVLDSAFVVRFNDMIGRVASLQCTSAVTEVLYEVVALMKCNGAVFMSFARQDDSFQSYRYFVACPQFWCNQYVSERWFMIDPALVYAQLHSEPIAGDDIPLSTEGQRIFRQRAYEVAPAKPPNPA